MSRPSPLHCQMPRLCYHTCCSLRISMHRTQTFSFGLSKVYAWPGSKTLSTFAPTQLCVRPVTSTAGVVGGPLQGCSLFPLLPSCCMREVGFGRLQSWANGGNHHRHLLISPPEKLPSPPREYVEPHWPYQTSALHSVLTLQADLHSTRR